MQPGHVDDGPCNRSDNGFGELVVAGGDAANVVESAAAASIRDADGIVRIPSGSLPSDADLLRMDYFVLGVKGELPEAPAFGPTD